MEDRRVLVTGGAGFIGSNLANTLALDNDVVALDNGYLGTPDNLDDGVEYVEADVLDDGLPTDVDVVFHLAALSSRQMLEENPREGARVNIEGFVNVVEQASVELAAMGTNWTRYWIRSFVLFAIAGIAVVVVLEWVSTRGAQFESVTDRQAE